MSSSRSVNFHRDGTLFIVSGPSGSGKTTLINRVREQLEPIGIHLHFSVSHTTRAVRTGESDGVDYHYVTRAEFEQMVERSEFIEWAHVHGQMYGTSKTEVLARLQGGQDVILDIDVQGAQQIAESEELKPRSISTFVFPPSFEELEARIRNRGVNTEAEIQLRLEKAQAEIEEGCSFYDYVIINDDVDIATECLKSAIIARKLKTRTAIVALREMARRFKEERHGRVT